MRLLATVLAISARETIVLSPLSVESHVPRFFFDILDAGSDQRDPDGVKCTILEAVMIEVKRTLPAIATDELPRDGDHRNYMVVRRARGWVRRLHGGLIVRWNPADQVILDLLAA